MSVTEVFKLPKHGSYVSDCFGPAAAKYLLSFKDEGEPGGRTYTSENTLAILLAFVKNAYPSATFETLHRYENKCFTIFGTRSWNEYLIIYRHDWVWYIISVNQDEYKSWREQHPYYAAAPEELPEY